MKTPTPSTSSLRKLLARWWKPAFTVLLLGLCLLFVRQEGPQLAEALRLIPQTPMLVAGVAAVVTGVYLLLNGLIYVYGFRSAGARVPLAEAIQLWLRRNFLSVFLPAGGVAALAFYNRPLRRETPTRPALTEQQIYTGALVYIVVGYGSLLVVALPVLALGLGKGVLNNAYASVLALLALILGAVAIWRSFRTQGRVYQLGERYLPQFMASLEPLRTQSLNRTELLRALLASVGIELCGIAHVGLAAWAVGHPVSISVALTAYVVATLFFALSPVLRGLGAVETSLTLVLTRLGGMDLPSALAATLYYRVFEFWLPLVLGMISFIGQRSNFVWRVLPVFLTLTLGIVNLLSALTPGLANRVRLLEGLLPISVLEMSNYVIIGLGLLLVGLSIGLLRGYRPAWTITVGLVGLSMVLHLTKAFDFEETLFAGFVLFVMLYTQPNYRLATPPLRRLARVPIRARETAPAVEETTPEIRQRAAELASQYGRSALDYFKLYPDKELVLFADVPAFVAYRLSGRYAVVLEGPVCPPEQLADTIQRFDRLCYGRGYQPLYHRVDAQEVPFYTALRKKALKIGQEGLVDLTTFTLEGRDHKSLRNALKRVQTAGYTTHVYAPPLRDALVQQLRAVSDEWLRSEGIEETAFSQGVFRATDIKQQSVVTVENPEGKLMAFATIVPDYAPGEGTYDLIRKTDDAPNGASDVLLVALVQYGQQQGWQSLNVGLAPFSGLDEAHNVAEQALKLAYQRIRAFDHYKGLRAFKEKYATVWRDKYLLYNDDLDLVQVSFALQRVGQYRTTSP